ncbi:SRPBCC domain-containing protein [Bradyrhizobium lablabi]|uniref:SRPBCC family protein n=1 Tax=Bradyrhizobium lablabi TaxID=722472 RepID=UPI001BA7787A|nr:SRPBCC family protein [Bradyrhizobium lablabi]MBR1122321.1 SRPBCC domain-containing protein [Bradyrhizobium lablabi]
MNQQVASQAKAQTAEPFIVRRETQIAAPPATVFAFLTDPEKIVSWMGTEAETEMHPGGLYLLKGIHGRAARGTFREVVPVHRLAYTFGWDGSEEVPPGSSLIEIDLIERDGGTLLCMTHSGLPTAAQCESHSTGWAHYLARLTLSAVGRDPGPDVRPK